MMMEQQTHDYWRRESDGSARLIASRCKKCGQHHLPRVAFCGTCRGTQFEDAPLSPKGNLYSYTVIHTPPAGYPDIYVVGYVDFPEQVRVFGQVRADNREALRCDMPVGIEIATLKKRPDGSPVEGYRFVPLLAEASS
jgi:uncharacterized OB-fold protein